MAIPGADGTFETGNPRYHEPGDPRHPGIDREHHPEADSAVRTRDIAAPGRSANLPHHGFAPGQASFSHACRARRRAGALRPRFADAADHPDGHVYLQEYGRELVAYAWRATAKAREEYGRYGNPTVRVLEERVAALEGAEDAAAFSSGMAAVTSAIFALVGQGGHVVLFQRLAIAARASS